MILVCLFLALSLGLLLSLEFLNWPALVVASCCFLVSTSCSRQHSSHCSICSSKSVPLFCFDCCCYCCCCAFPEPFFFCFLFFSILSLLKSLCALKLPPLNSGDRHTQTDGRTCRRTEKSSSSVL